VLAGISVEYLVRIEQGRGRSPAGMSGQARGGCSMVSSRVFPDWDRVADEQVFALSCSPADDYSATFRSGLSAQAGEQFTRRLKQHQLPARGTLRWTLPAITGSPTRR
jgi:hypothetical protein